MAFHEKDGILAVYLFLPLKQIAVNVVSWAEVSFCIK